MVRIVVAVTCALLGAGSVRAEPAGSDIAALVGRVGDGQGPAPIRACKLNGTGSCVYTAKTRIEAERAGRTDRSLDADELALVAAYEAFLADPARAAAPEAPAYRYHLARLLAESGAFARARPHLEHVSEGADPRAAWAAALLIDGLVVAWTEAPREQRDAAGEELARALTRLQALPVWSIDAARDLRAAAITIEVGLRWRRAEAWIDRGRTTSDPDAQAAAFASCGREFQALHVDFGDRHDRADALLWNAARCFEAAYQVDEAMKLLAALVDRHPRSELRVSALRLLAEMHDSLARFGEAASWYERHAAADPRGKESVDSLARAVELRAALGPRERLLAALEAFERRYAGRDSRRAAEIRWFARTVVPRSDAERRDHLVGFLRDHGRSAPRGLRALAAAELARLLFVGTCPKEPMIGALCLSDAPGRPVTLVERSGPRRAYATRRWSSPRRAGAEFEEAARHAASVRALARASQSWRGDEEDARALAEAVAAAALLEADAALEAVVAGRARASRSRPLHLTPEELPRGSGGAATMRTRSAARIGLAEDVADEVDAIDEAYAAIVRQFPDSAAATRAHARQGLLHEWLAERALLAMPPGSLDRSSFDALRAEALVAYRACLAPAPASLAAGESVAYCEQRLATLAPRDPALIRELLGAEAPGYPADRPDVAGPILDADEALRLGARAAAVVDGGGLEDHVP